MNFYGIDLHNRILQVGQYDVSDMDILHRLQHDASRGTGDSTGIGSGGSTSIGTRTCIDIGAGA